MKLPGRIIPDPVTGRVQVAFDDLPQFPFSRFNMHLFGSERGSPRDPDAMRYLSGGKHLHTVELGAAGSDFEAVLHPRLGAERGGVPGRLPCHSIRRSWPASPTRPPASTRPSRSRSIATDGDQTLAGVTRLDPAGVLRDPEGHPVLPGGGPRQLSESGYTGLAEQAIPPAPRPARSGRRSPRSGPEAGPSTSPAGSSSPGRTTGAQLSLVVVTPAVSGPYDLGNVAVRVADLRSTRSPPRSTAVSDPIPQIIDGIPLRCARCVIDLDRPGLHPQPDQLRARSWFRACSAATKAARPARRPTSRSANCADLPYGPKLKLRLTGSMKRRGHPAIHAILTTEAGRSEHPPGRRSPCRRAGCSTTPTSRRSAPASSSPPNAARRAR